MSLLALLVPSILFLYRRFSPTVRDWWASTNSNRRRRRVTEIEGEIAFLKMSMSPLARHHSFAVGMADLARAGLAFTMCLAAAIFLPLDVLGLRQYFTLFDQEFLEQQRNLPISLPLFLMVWLFTGFAFLLPIAAMVYYLLHALDSFRSSSVIYIVRRTKQAQARLANLSVDDSPGQSK